MAKYKLRVIFVRFVSGSTPKTSMKIVNIGDVMMSKWITPAELNGMTRKLYSRQLVTKNCTERLVGKKNGI